MGWWPTVEKEEEDEEVAGGGGGWRELAMAGAYVVLACRNTKAASEIANKWKEACNSKNLNVEVMELDLLSLSSVHRFTEKWMQRSKPLHVLINNAGIYKLGEPQRFSNEGIEQHMQVNHVSPALLTLLLLPSLLRAPSSRIINVNSVAHLCGTLELESWNSRIEEKKFSGLRAYADSKLVNLMFLKTLANKLIDESKKATIQCIAVHPGAVGTNVDHLGPIMRKAHLFWVFDSAQGARSVSFCATRDAVAENLVKGFAYYSYTCKPDRIASQAEDIDACFEVWKKTMEILQLDADYVHDLLVRE
ncbi:Short-chain dehydrogenase/reductase SDR [Macleaya cordata]|uniref:Short-chain dehydrogenase/reductase SDR n=1 Tax=Macleaya cordata TaxID=56857 RepID=A0A200Q1F4_MACCD|nr:Short-chain dehydrogenase/reductase SDR [Macleaya cordata]